MDFQLVSVLLIVVKVEDNTVVLPFELASKQIIVAVNHIEANIDKIGCTLYYINYFC